MQFLCLLQACYPPDASVCSTQKLPSPRPLGGQWLIKSLSIGAWICKPVFGLSGAQPYSEGRPHHEPSHSRKLWCGRKGLVRNSKRHPYLYLGFQRVLGVLCQELGSKTKYIFLLYYREG